MKRPRRITLWLCAECADCVVSRQSEKRDDTSVSPHSAKYGPEYVACGGMYRTRREALACARRDRTRHRAEQAQLAEEREAMRREAERLDDQMRVRAQHDWFGGAVIPENYAELSRKLGRVLREGRVHLTRGGYTTQLPARPALVVVVTPPGESAEVVDALDLEQVMRGVYLEPHGVAPMRQVEVRYGTS